MSTDYPTQDPDLFSKVLRELKTLRSAKGEFTPEQLAGCEALSSLALQAPQIDSWNWIRNHTEELCRRNQFARCARLAAFGPGANVLARLTNAGAPFGIDQRTARTWSDTGLPLLAATLVDAGYLVGSRAMHVIDLAWQQDPEPDGQLSLYVFWAGHSNLRRESIRVYLFDTNDGAAEFRELDDGEGLVQEIPLQWRDLVPPRGSFTLQTGLHLAVPPPRSFDYQDLVLRFGSQSTLFVRVVNLPRLPDCTVAVNTYRQGVTFSFLRDIQNPPIDPQGWDGPIRLHLGSRPNGTPAGPD